MSIEVYTAITGGRDEPRSDIKCFTEYSEFKRPVMNAKIYKILSHQYIDTDISIWVDGNIFLLIDKEKLVEEFLGEADMVMFRHPLRKTVWDEFSVLEEDDRFKNDYLQSQLAKQKAYYKKFLSGDCPIWECNFIIRRRNDRVINLMNKWWAEICKWNWRDQVSFPYIVRNSDIKLKTINSNIRDNKFFKHIEHD